MLVTTNMGKKTQKTNMGSTIAQESEGNFGLIPGT